MPQSICQQETINGNIIYFTINKNNKKIRISRDKIKNIKNIKPCPEISNGIFPRLTPNYQHILDNFDNLSINDFLVTDTNLNIFFKNLDYVSSAITRKNSYNDNILKENEKIIANLILGSGGVGVIIEYNDHEVLKMINTFNQNFYRTPIFVEQTDTHYIFSNDIFEGITSIYINKLLTKFSDCYYKTYGIYASQSVISDKKEKWMPNYEPETVAILSELLNLLPKKWYHHDHPDFYYILYIILHNIYILQNTCQFVHGDLHLDNIMSKFHDGDVQLAYENEIIILSSRGYIPILNDFGHSSFTRNNKRVVSNIEPKLSSGSSYNNKADVSRLMYSIINNRSYDNFKNRSYDSYKNQSGNENISGIIFQDVEEIFLKVPSNDKYQRINYEKISNNLKPIKEILSYLLTKLTYNIKSQSFNFNMYVDDFFDIIKITDPIVNITPSIQYHHIIYDVPDPYWKIQKFSNKLNIHMISIANSRNYHFKNKCCKQNVFDFLKSYNNGVAINGTYFNLDTGKYIDKYLKQYTNNIGKVSVYNDHIKIIPTKYNNSNNQIFTSAPLLVTNGQAVQIDLNAKDENGKYLYVCDPNYSLNEEEYQDCNRINSGELYHLSNPNPRTILATKDKTTYFIVITGRTEEFQGASVDQMQDFLINYLHVDNAINLDGGASSLMMWKIKDKTYSPLDIINRKIISNVIGFVQ